MEHSLNIDEILARHWAGEALDAAEQQVLEAYMADNGDEYRRLDDIMARLDKAERHIHVDTIAAWHKIEGRLRPESRPALRFKLSPLWMAAAMLLLIVGFGFYRQLTDVPTLNLANNTAETKEYRLPDGSTLKLYPNATLAYTVSERKAERTVELTGKAFFDVTHNGQSFTVNAGQLQVEVLGTSFAVDATHEGREQVSVSTGRVLVKTKDEETVLTRGQRVNVSQGHMKKDSAGADAQQAVFVFKDTPIKTAIDKIEKAMDIKIEMAPELDNNNRITTQIKSTDPSEVIRELTLLCNCRYDSISPIHYKLRP